MATKTRKNKARKKSEKSDDRRVRQAKKKERAASRAASAAAEIADKIRRCPNGPANVASAVIVKHDNEYTLLHPMGEAMLLRREMSVWALYCNGCLQTFKFSLEQAVVHP